MKKLFQFVAIILFLASFYPAQAADSDYNIDPGNPPILVVKDINISPTTKIINVTIENQGGDLHYQETDWVMVTDMDNKELYQGMVTVMKSGETKTVLMEDNWSLNKASDALVENSTGIYHLKAKAGNSELEKIINLNTTQENTLEISNVKVNTDFAAGDRVAISWETNIPSEGNVIMLSSGASFPDTISSKTHNVEISNLKPNTKYSYYIKAQAGTLSQQTLYSGFVTNGDKSELPDLAIGEVLLKDQVYATSTGRFSGNLLITIENIGQASMVSNDNILVHVMIRSSWLSVSEDYYFKVFVKGEKKIYTIPIENASYDGTALKVSVWVDSNTLVNRQDEPVSDDLSVVESNENNNTFYGLIKPSVVIPVNNNSNIPARLAIINSRMHDRLKGKIILKVSDQGKAYYVSPSAKAMYYLGKPEDAYAVMRSQGIGISNADLQRIPIGLSSESGIDADGDGLSDALEDAIGTDKFNNDTDIDGYDDRAEVTAGYSPIEKAGTHQYDKNFANAQKGKIFLQVEHRGEAWYVNPADGKRYFLGRAADAYSIMRVLSLGISNADFQAL
jgi:hypothetical protein